MHIGIALLGFNIGFNRKQYFYNKLMVAFSSVNVHLQMTLRLCEASLSRIICVVEIVADASVEVILSLSHATYVISVNSGT